MNTLYQLVSLARTNEPLDPDEARYAIVAFDVLMSKLNLTENAVQLAEYFAAAEAVPREYVGDANDPNNPEAVAWYRSMDAVEFKPAECTCDNGLEWLRCPVHDAPECYCDHEFLPCPVPGHTKET